MLISNGWFLRPVTMTCNRQLRPNRVCDGRAAEGMQFPWRWNGGTISTVLDVIWEMSVCTTLNVIWGMSVQKRWRNNP